MATVLPKVSKTLLLVWQVGTVSLRSKKEPLTLTRISPCCTHHSGCNLGQSLEAVSLSRTRGPEHITQHTGTQGSPACRSFVCRRAEWVLVSARAGSGSAYSVVWCNETFGQGALCDDGCEHSTPPIGSSSATACLAHGVWHGVKFHQREPQLCCVEQQGVPVVGGNTRCQHCKGASTLCSHCLGFVGYA